MPGKKRECTGCHRLMRSDNLKNHIKKCIGSVQSQFLPTDNIQDHSSNVLSVSKPTNPKISALVDAIVNEEPISKDKKPTSKYPDDCSDDNDSEIEPIDMTPKDLKFEDDHEDEDEDDDSDNDLSDSGIEPMDLTAAPDDNISPNELKARLYRFDDDIKVFELNLDADKRLSKNDILKYVEELEIPKFRGVFERDGLPKSSNQIECGIVNLKNHWVCYTKIYNTRCYFNSFGRKTPVEIEYYLKTSKEIKNNSPVIFRSGYMVQRERSKISGHLCLFVLTSIMREYLTFKQVTDQLIYGFSEYYW